MFDEFEMDSSEPTDPNSKILLGDVNVRLFTILLYNSLLYCAIKQVLYTVCMLIYMCIPLLVLLILYTVKYYMCIYVPLLLPLLIPYPQIAGADVVIVDDMVRYMYIYIVYMYSIVVFMCRVHPMYCQRVYGSEYIYS